MKQVMIIVRPGCYFKTKQALSDNRFFAMSTKEVLGRGKAFSILLQEKVRKPLR